MTILNGDIIYLRALEFSDLEFLYDVENNEHFWEVSGTQTPFSKYVLQKYIENAQQDIYEAKQYRFVICNKENMPVGLIDLFDFNPQHKRVGVGILIVPDQREKGFASEALDLIIDYAFTYLNVHQVYANVLEDNYKSISLFEKLNFQKIGVKDDWIYSNGGYKNEILFQLIK